MSIKKNALWNMAYRYKKAAQSEANLVEAEKLTAKAVEYFEAWEKACE